jgi:hypothetical protein
LSPQPIHTDEPGKTPIPELNPMLNPLLAQNMGRWAEVYFTHPPDEREQAVKELVHQLEQESKERETQISNSPAFSEVKSKDEIRRSPAEPTIACGGCGHENPLSQRYCGMCGVALAQPASSVLEQIPPTAAIPAAPGTLAEETWENSQAAVSEVPEGSSSHYFLEERPRGYDSEIEPPTFSTEPSFSYSYRIFLGLAIAIVLGVLGYIAWHRNQTLSQEPPQAPPVSNEQSAAPNQESSQKAEQNTNPAPTPPAKTQEPANAQDSTTKPENVAKEAAPRHPAATPKTAEPPSSEDAAPVEKAALTRAAKTERVAANASGADELATAQRYLNGEAGRRDPAQAVQWLWKSVAKQNSQATLMLADLYLHGDGIQKNCDQARILLDAAASKGQTGAATRLRNLQAFGCH